jgi:DnaJ-domain-containing protein 1
MASAPTDDPFDTLGLPAVFTLDTASIERAALSKLSRLHPDMGGNMGANAASADANADADLDQAVQAARINAARDTLLFTLARAEALLKRLGGPAKEADKSLPPGFLVEIMSVREQAEESLASSDPASRATWMQWSLNQRTQAESHAASLFTQAASNPAALRDLRTHLNKWRYIERLIEQLDPAYHQGRSDVGGVA